MITCKYTYTKNTTYFECPIQWEDNQISFHGIGIEANKQRVRPKGKIRIPTTNTEFAKNSRFGLLLVRLDKGEKPSFVVSVKNKTPDAEGNRCEIVYSGNELPEVFYATNFVKKVFKSYTGIDITTVYDRTYKMSLEDLDEAPVKNNALNHR